MKMDTKKIPQGDSPVVRRKIRPGVVLASLAAAFITYALLGIVFHDDIIYPFDQTPFRAPGGEQHIVDGDIPVTIFKAEQDSDVIFYLQGNVASRSSFAEDILAHHAAGYTVVTMNWSGSEGRPGDVSEALLKSEALSVMNAIPKLIGDDDPSIHIHGYSMGSGIASFVASQTEPETLILQSSYSSLCRVMSGKTFLPACYLPGIETWDNMQYVAQIKAPVFMLHGLNDALIPSKYALELAKELASQDKILQVKTYENVGHNDFWKVDNIADIHKFIRTQNAKPDIPSQEDLQDLFSPHN